MQSKKVSEFLPVYCPVQKGNVFMELFHNKELSPCKKRCTMNYECEAKNGNCSNPLVSDE